MFGNDKAEKTRDYLNALATMSNALHAMQHRKDTWDARIKTVQEMQKLLPLIIRYQIWFKNTE